MSTAISPSLVKIGLKTKKFYQYAKFWQDPFLNCSDSSKHEKLYFALFDPKQFQCCVIQYSNTALIRPYVFKLCFGHSSQRKLHLFSQREQYVLLVQVYTDAVVADSRGLFSLANGPIMYNYLDHGTPFSHRTYTYPLA